MPGVFIKFFKFSKGSFMERDVYYKVLKIKRTACLFICFVSYLSTIDDYANDGGPAKV